MAKILHQKLNEEINLFNALRNIPSYIEENLKHPLREYQLSALSYFIQTQKQPLANIEYNHLLFRMATGSGKTNLLASVILYLFEEYSYKNFLFYVNSDAVIKKTYDNLFNSLSSKYLFKEDVFCIKGEKVELKSVENFPVIPAENTIYLKISSVQKLHLDIQNPSENTLTLEDMKEQKIVLLSDEAHHINAKTKGSKKNSLENKKGNWEESVLKVLDLNRENRLLEFTATLNLDNKELLNKYQNKVVFNYDLKAFMSDQYSKNVGIIRNNESDEQKVLNAVLLNQYRKYIAFAHGIDLKPVILFKSNSIKISLETHQNFTQMINNLTVEDLNDFIIERLAQSGRENLFLKDMYDYYLNMDLSKVISDLKFEFKEENLINANDKNFLSENNISLLNSLEDPSNNIRGIFAVAKLNEGWDVLNLFDIVRISESASKSKTSTDSEAQLIGRGARYFPFIYEYEKQFQRRFDYKDSPLKILEKLHYHTINENAYIKNLNKSLNDADISIQDDKYITYNASIKKEILNSNFYKEGKLYVNQTVKLTKKDYNSLGAYGVPSVYEYHIEELIEQELLTGETTKSDFLKVEVQLEIENKIWEKAIYKNKFYYFSNLVRFVPNIKSIDEFIKHKKYLGGLKVFIIIPKGLEGKFYKPSEKLKIASLILDKISSKIKSNYMKEIGTTLFEPIPVKELVNDYSVNVGKYSNPTFNQIISSHQMKNKPWYVYDNAIVNGLELNLINYIEGIIDKVYEKYGEVYLIRNEKQVKLVEFNNVRGFMPDFILYLKELDTVYQLFIEPKADVLRDKDSWKEEMLISLSNDARVDDLGEVDDVKILGIKFFSNTPFYKTAFREDFYEKLNLD